MLKRFLSFIILAFLLTNFSVSANKIGPPYPTVWGYDLSNLVAPGEEIIGLMPNRMDDGDVWFIATVSSKKPVSNKNILIKFFKREQLELNKKELEKIFKIIEKQKIRRETHTYTEEFTFSDGSKIQFCSHQGGGRYFIPDWYERYFLKTYPKGQQKKYSIFTVSPKVYVQSIHGWVDQSISPFYYYKLHLATNIIYLKDDTFLVYDKKSQLILRLDKDLNTQFQPVKPCNFFVIEYSLINKIDLKYPKGCSLASYQYIHDVLLHNFYNQYHH